MIASPIPHTFKCQRAVDYPSRQGTRVAEAVDIIDLAIRTGGHFLIGDDDISAAASIKCGQCGAATDIHDFVAPTSAHTIRPSSIKPVRP